MKKLTEIEQNAVNWLNRQGSYCLGDEGHTEAGRQVTKILFTVVKKKRATVEMTDDGPRFHISAQGREDAF